MSNAKLEELERILEVVRSGYAGTLPNGNIVDRREHPEAVPIQENTLLGAPKPRQVDSEAEQGPTEWGLGVFY